jgi:hypothetical protein
VRGLVATAFTHRDSRAGDPDLHTHVAVANKVQILDPTWAKLVRTLVDGFQCLADVVGQGVFGCERVAAGVDLDGAVAA